MEDYQLVGCDFHDELEALAMHRQPCKVVYHTETDEVTEIKSQIVDVYAKDHADYLKLQDGTEIRLDRLVSVDDKPVQFVCE
jgi:Rho-binding antiterminator